MEDANHNYRNRRSSQQDKLQRLWQELQDLSEVQDQSRNQQVPAFFNDDSRHLQQSSFINTNHILNESADCQNIVQQQYGIDKSKYQSLQDTVKLREYGQTNYQSTNKYNYSQFSPYNQDKYSKIETYQQAKVSKEHDKHKTLVNDQSLEQVNERLLSDNKKLFDECIKLRKSLLVYEKRQQIKTEGNNLQSKTNQLINLVSQKQKFIKQLQSTVKTQQAQINELLSQNKTLKEKLYFNQIQSAKQKREITQNFRIQQDKMKKQLQYEIQSKYDKKISSLQSLLNLRQKQVAEQKLSNKQAQFKLAQIKNQLLDQKHLRQKLQLQINQYQSQLQKLKNQQTPHSPNKLPTPQDHAQKINYHPGDKIQYSILAYQKQSRANSIKSTSISCNSSFNNEKSHCLSLNQKGSYSNSSLESTLKDKQRQITNMKIVHEAQLNKHKQMIKQLEQQLFQFKQSVK